MDPAVVVALIGGAISLTAAILGHRRSKKVDDVSAQAGNASNHRAGTQQVIEGLNLLLKQYQEDNDDFRDDIKSLWTRFDVVTAERDTCRSELARLKRKYGYNGNDTPNPPSKIL